MIEIEILDDENEPRDFDDVVKEFRKRVIMQETGNITLTVKSHLDDMVSEFDNSRSFNWNSSRILEEDNIDDQALLLHGHRRHALQLGHRPAAQVRVQ